MNPYRTRVLRIKDVLQGGRIVRKRYIQTGSGLDEVVIKRDHLNRRIVERRGRRKPVQSAPPKRVSKTQIMDQIGGALSGMRVGSMPRMRGRGITPM